MIDQISLGAQHLVVTLFKDENKDNRENLRRPQLEYDLKEYLKEREAGKPNKKKAGKRKREEIDVSNAEVDAHERVINIEQGKFNEFNIKEVKVSVDVKITEKKKKPNISIKPNNQ